MRTLGVLVVLVLAGCGGPVGNDPGASCDAGVICEGNHARSCEGGKWVDYPCPGPTGCVADAGAGLNLGVVCDMIGAPADAKCVPTRGSSVNWCSPDAGQEFFCQDGQRLADKTCDPGWKCAANDAAQMCRPP